MHTHTRTIRLWMLVFLTLRSLVHAAQDVPTEMVGANVQVLRGAVNGVLLERNGKTLAIYGDPRKQPASADTVLFTHHRRDVVWAGRTLVAAGAKAVVPAGELADFTEVGTFWSGFAQKRFHDYTHKSTKVLGEPMTVAKTVRGGEALTWEGFSIRVLDTPGYTRGAISYLMDLDGQRIAFTGDLIYGDGKLLDLYSLQDAIPEAKMMAYHGYAARLADVIASLNGLAAERPTLIVPSRGPVIRNPAAAIATLISRARTVYTNYLSIDAHHYYSGEEQVPGEGPAGARTGGQVRLDAIGGNRENRCRPGSCRLTTRGSFSRRTRQDSWWTAAANALLTNSTNSGRRAG